MKAIHVKWTKPCKSNDEDFEILTTILSAMKWRQHNGSIGLVTDKKGAEFYRNTGMDKLWDDGIDTRLESIPDTINPDMFWAAGKIFALEKCIPPVAVIDTDFIVWNKLDFDKTDNIYSIHSEEIMPDVYPSKDFFHMKNGYGFDDELDWSLKPYNTAFYVVKNRSFIDYYTSQSKKFMINSCDCNDNLRYMLFAEQRLFAMSAKKTGEKVNTFAQISELYINNKMFTHVWGMKQQMRENEKLRMKFCHDCANRIKKDFSSLIPTLKKIECIGKYFD